MKTEQDYRVTYEVAKLMKQADYKGQSFAYYNYKGEYFTCAYAYTNNVLEIIEAPLTAMALYWAESLGYKLKVTNELIYGVSYKIPNAGKIIIGSFSFNHIPSDNELYNTFLTAVCNHIITNKTNK